MDVIRRRVSSAMRRLARDETTATASRSALVLAPHPDDETLGCGATILRKVAAGSTVTVLVVTDGRHSHRSAALSPDELAALRYKEMAQAAERLGLPDQAVRWGGFVDGTVGERQDDLVALIGALLAELRPQDLFATCAAEPHPDHAAVGRAARLAAAAATTPVRVLEYPVWLWGSWPLRRGDRLSSTLEAARILLTRRVAKVATAGLLAGKLHALEAHDSQLHRPAGVPDDEEWAALPPAVLAAAADEFELFMPVQVAMPARRDRNGQ